MTQRNSQPKYALNKNKYLLPAEAEHLRALCARLRASETRNSLLIETALRTGARASELLLITTNDLDPAEQCVFVRGLKGSNDREIPLEKKFFQDLYKFSQTRRALSADPQSPTPLFAIGYPRLWQIWEFYRPVEKKFHSLRHTFAIELYQRTRDLRLVQVALGHRSIANTMIYADYVYSKQELRRLLL